MQSRMKGVQRREAIVKTAIQLFSQNGFRGTTTRQLAAAVGVTEPVLYQHFKTKRDLYGAILETKAEEGCQRFRELLGPYLDGDDDRAFLSRLAELILDHQRRDPGFVRLLLFSALEKHELAELFYERQFLAFRRMVVRYLRRRARAGAIRNIDPNLAARIFLGMVSNYGLNQVLFGERIAGMSRKKIIAGMVSAFLEGVGAR
jgi:AcrR family transcriptional regulator